MSNSKRISAMLIALMMTLSLVACGSGGTEEATETPAEAASTEAPAAEETIEKVDLKISHHPYAHALPGIYASENGMYDDYFNYTIDLYSNGPVQNEAIASGAWEVGTTGLGGAVLGIIGYDMKVLGVTTPDTLTTDMWVRPDSALASADVNDNGIIGTADDWRGLTVLCNRGTICHVVLLGTLEYLGLTEADINIVDASVANCYTAFLAGEADVVCLWDSMGAKALDNGWVKVSSASALGIDMPALIVATDAAVNEKPEAVEQWLSIYLDAAKILIDNPDMAAEMLYEFQNSEGVSVTEDECKVIVRDRPFIALEDQVDWVAENDDGSSRLRDALLAYADFMLSQGNISQEDYDKMAQSDFVLSDYILDLAK